MAPRRCGCGLKGELEPYKGVHAIARGVMAGLVPATHALLSCAKDVGARHKAGHDNREIVRPRVR